MIKLEKLPPDILSRVRGTERLLVQDPNVVFAYLFGGLARGVVKPLSDVDIAVYLRDTANLAEYKILLFDRLTELLGTSELDLVTLNTAPVSIVGRILQNKLVLVDKEPFLRHQFESVKLREFFDFRIKEDAFFARRYGLGG
jgi:predicted nucleotidyltransferase